MKRVKFAAILSALVLCSLPSTASGRTWSITSDGTGDAATIQAGIDSASSGDTVLVEAGTYFENLSIVGKELLLTSRDGASATILDGGSVQETVVFLMGLSRSTVVEGFTMTGGQGHIRGSGRDGGGIFMQEASPVIRRNVFTANSSRYGGGIYSTSMSGSAAPLIEMNTFEGNVSDLGAGLLVGPGTPEIRENIFRNNNCRFDGGAVYFALNSGFATVEHNQFWSNSAGDHGGAIDVYGTNASEVLIAWNLFVDNDAGGTGTGDTGAGGGMHLSNVHGSIINNTIVEGDVPLEVACSGGGISLESIPPDLEISRNIIAFNRDCGIACRFSIQNTLGTNLFWMNENGNLGSGLGTCPAEWSSNQIVADPLFCGPGLGNYSVSIESQALTGSSAIGVWTSPGCGPGVATRPSTWGSLKALFR